MPTPQSQRPRSPKRIHQPRSLARARRARGGASAPLAHLTPQTRMLGIASGGLTAAVLFGVLTARVRGQWTTPVDRVIRRQAKRRVRHPAAHLAATGVGALGDTLAYVPAAVAGRWLLRRRGAGGGGAVLGAALTVALGRHVFRWIFPRFRPPTHLLQWNMFASYPSGHATGAVAVGFTAAHVLAHEGLVPPMPALAAAAALSAAVGVARVAGDEHWGTDILGGWLAGAVVASGATLAYEAHRLRRA